MKITSAGCERQPRVMPIARTIVRASTNPTSAVTKGATSRPVAASFIGTPLLACGNWGATGTVGLTTNKVNTL